MEQKTKVLHVLWSGGIGGAEEYITTLVKHFDPLKYEVHLCFLSEMGPIFEEFQKMDPNVIFIGMKSGYDFFGALRFFKYLYTEKFDVIHSHTENIISNVLITFLKRPAKILTEHVSPGEKDLFKKRKLFYKLCSNSFDVFIAISEFVKQKLIDEISVDPAKIVVVHNSVYIDKYDNSVLYSEDMALIRKKDVCVIGFVGRMHRFKRPELFVEIAKKLIEKNDKFYFVMVGDGPALERCRELIANYKIGDYFRLLGYRRDVPNLLKSFDALLFTSVGEGFGVVLLEALAAGVPVFAVKDGAIPEIIRHKKNGILCDSADPEIFAGLVADSLQDKELIARIKKQSVEDAHSRFSIEACARKTEEVYEKVIGGGI